MRAAILCGVAVVSFSAAAWEGPKLTVDETAAPVTRTWSEVRQAISNSIARTGEGYFAYSKHYNDLGPLDTSGELSVVERQTQFAMSCILASPLTIRGKVPTEVAGYLKDWGIMNVHSDIVGRQGHVVARCGAVLAVKKYLWGMNNGTAAIAFYNPTDCEQAVRFAASELEYEGGMDWKDFFSPAEKGKGAAEFALTLPAHGTRMFFVSGTARMRSSYETCCAIRRGTTLVWDSVYVPKDGVYHLEVRSREGARYSLVINGLSLGNFVGSAALPVKLFEPENSVRITGDENDLSRIDGLMLGK